MPLTVCPLSNLRLCVIDDMHAHPLRRMLEAGLNVSVNSDDPAYFGGYVNDNYRAVAEALALSDAESARPWCHELAGGALRRQLASERSATYSLLIKEV